MRTNYKKVTLQTLAAQLDVSTATVSRALKNDRMIGSDTRARVLAAAARLGYDRPNREGPAKDEHLRVLLLLPPHVREINTMVFPSYLRGVTTAATALGCALSIEEITDAQYGKMNRRRELPRAIRHGDADIVLLTGGHHPNDVAALVQELPVVSIQWDYATACVDLVTAFNTLGIVEIVAALVKRGHRRLVWVAAEYEASFYRERQAGFIQGCMQHKIFPEANWFLTISEIDAPLLEKLRAQQVTALVAANDDVAFRLADLCQQHGIRIPEDLSLTGFDGTQQSLRNGKRLTTYDPCLTEVGRAAVQLAVQRAREPGASRMMQSRGGRLIEGETVLKLK